MARRNLDPNPACAVNTNGRIQAGGTAAPVQVTGLTTPWVRPTAGRITAATNTTFLTQLGAPHAPGVDLSGRPITAWMQWSISAVPTGDTLIYLLPADAATGGNYLANTAVVTIPPAQITAGAVVSTRLRGVLPTGTRRVHGTGYVNNPAASSTLTIGLIRLELVDDPNLGPADGTDPGWIWDGTAGASTSYSWDDGGQWWGLLASYY